MNKENPRHLRTALIASLVLHAGLLTVLTLDIIGSAPDAQPASPLPIPIKVQFWNPQSRSVPPAAEAATAAGEPTSAVTSTTPLAPTAGSTTEPRVSLRYAQPRTTGQDRTDMTTGNEPQLDMANVRNGIEALVRQAAKDHQMSGKDWCQDTPPRRPGEPCKTALSTPTALQQSVAAILAGSITARDGRCGHYVPVYNSGPVPGATLLGLIDPTRPKSEFIKPEIKNIGPDTGGTLNLLGANIKADGKIEATGATAAAYNCLQ